MENNIYELLYMALSEDVSAIEMMNQQFQGMFNHLYNEAQQSCQYYNHEDAMADCFSALLTAVRSYRRDKELQFSSFVYLCCRRAMFNSVRSLRKQHYFEGESIYSLDYQLNEEKGSYLQDVCTPAEDEDDFSREVIMKTAIEQFFHQQCDPIEYEVYKMRQDGYSYREIAYALDISYKRVDNILQKIRRKMASVFD